VLGLDKRLTASAAPLYYVLHSHAWLDLLLLESICTCFGLPGPREPLPGFMEKKSSTSLASTRRRLFRRPVPGHQSQELKRLQRHLARHPDTEVMIVPVQIFWERIPRREHSLWRLLLSEDWRFTSRLSRIIALLFNRRHVLAEFGDPISLRTLIDEVPDSKRTTLKLHRLLRRIFREQRQVMLGPDISRRRIMIHGILQSSEVKNAIDTEARARNISPQRCRRQARRHAHAIVSNLSYFSLRVMDIFLTHIWNHIYDNITVSGIEHIQAMAGKHTLIYVPCHRSHMDYMLLSYLLFYQGFMIPHIAAGKNLDIPIINRLLRGGGAFFMRRRFGNAPIYKAVFSEYLHRMCERGYSIEYFIEGGRSRTGRQLPARTGMLSMTLRSYLRNPRRSIAFIPVYIGYEKIPEIGSYVSELQGNAKKKETLRGILGAVRKLHTNHGRVQVNFAPAIVLSEFLDETCPQWQADRNGKSPSWTKVAVNHLGVRIQESINSVASCNSTQMIACIMHATRQQAFSEIALRQYLEFLTSLLQSLPLGVLAPEIENADTIIRQAEALGMIRREQHAYGDVLACEPKVAEGLFWYRNNILHVFILPSLLATACRRLPVPAATNARKLCRLLYPLLCAEYLFPWNRTQLEAVLDDHLATLARLDLVPDTDRDVSMNGTTPDSLELLCGMIRDTLERYFLVLELCHRSGSKGCTSHELIECCVLSGQYLRRVHCSDAPETFDRATLRQVLRKLAEAGMVSLDVDEQMQPQESLGELLDMLGRVIDPHFRKAIMHALLRTRTGITHPHGT